MGSLVTAHQSSSVTQGEDNAPGYGVSAWLMHKIMLISFTGSGPEVLGSEAMCFITTGSVPLIVKQFQCMNLSSRKRALIRLLLSTFREKETKRSLKTMNNSIAKFSCPFSQFIESRQSNNDSSAM